MNRIIFTHQISDELLINLVNSAKTDNLLKDMSLDIQQRIDDYRLLGPVVAAKLDDEILGIGGVGKIHNGVGAAWLIISPLFIQYPKSLLKMCRQIIKEAFEGLKLHRIQMDIDSTFEENVRFADRLGFHCEGTMYKYGPNKEDYFRYVRLKD